MTPESFAKRGQFLRTRLAALFPARNCKTRVLKPTLSEVRQEITATRAHTFHEESVIDEEQAGVPSVIESIFDTAPVQPFQTHEESGLTPRERAQLAREVAARREQAWRAAVDAAPVVSVTVVEEPAVVVQPVMQATLEVALA